MWESLAASVIFFIILLILGGGFFLLRRRRLLKLFRVSKDSGLTIYLSRLQILQGGAIDFHGTPRSFAGPVVTAAEAGAATVLGSIFEYLIPGLESQAWDSEDPFYSRYQCFGRAVTHSSKCCAL